MTIQNFLSFSVPLSKRNRYLLALFFFLSASNGFSGLPAASTKSLEKTHGTYHHVIPPVLISPTMRLLSSLQNLLIFVLFIMSKIFSCS